MKELTLMPETLERTLAPERLSPNQGRIIQWVDAAYRPGTLMRAYGCARTQVTPPASTVLGCFTASSHDGQLLLLDGGSDSLRMTPSDGTVDRTGPLNMWADARSTEI